jgi:hypothetical protein
MVFKPGEVFWMRGNRLAGWGPLAPGEQWTPSAQPQQFANTNITWAAFQQEAAVIDPAGFTARPAEPLLAAAFAYAMPSPTFIASRLDAVRPTLRVGSTRVVPVIPGVTFQTDASLETTQTQLPPPPAQEPPPPVFTGPPPEPPPPPVDVIYPVPVYTGVIVVNPPEHPDYSRGRNRNRDRGGNQSQTPPAASPPPASPSPSKPASTPAPRNSDSSTTRREHPPVSAPPPPATPPVTPPPAQSAPPVPRIDPGPRREHAPAPAVTPAPPRKETPRSAPPPRAEPKPEQKAPESKPVPRPTGETANPRQSQRQ